MAVATRLTDRLRTSPTQKIPGRLNDIAAERASRSGDGDRLTSGQCERVKGDACGQAVERQGRGCREVTPAGAGTTDAEGATIWSA